MKKHIILLALLGLALGGCKQDPLADYPPGVRNATPGEEKPKDDGVGRDSLFIDTNEFYSVKEGETLTFEVRGRVLIPNATFEISVDNLHDFKGASFDSSTGTFTWKVPKDIVKTGPLMEIVHLKFVLETDRALVREKIVPIHVLRDLANPEIERVVNLNTPVREGEVKQFEVIVKSTEEVTQPTLTVVMNRAGAENGSSYVSMRHTGGANPIQSTADPTRWTFFLDLNLGNADITASQSSIFFGLQATSSFGISSPVMDNRVTVLTSWVEPRISWDNEVTFTAGQENTFNFTVFDPRSEGTIDASITNCATLGAVCSCAGVRSQRVCTIKWTPKATDVRRHTVNISATNNSTVSSDPYSKTKTFTKSILVVAAPAPTPTPAPSRGGN